MTGDDLSRCIHCGFCLEACPTYPLRGLEGESPRGRILILRGLMDGTLAPDREVLEPIRSCLGCGSCEPACPSGVPYLRILHAGRGLYIDAIDAGLPRRTRILKDLMLRRFLMSPSLLRAAHWLARVVARSGLISRLRHGRIVKEMGRSAEAMVSLLPEAPARSSRRSDPVLSEGTPVLLFRGCVAPILLPGVEPAATRLLTTAGFRVRVPSGQGCCGALSMHYGDPADARTCLRRNLRAFSGGDAVIVVTAAGCGAALREAGDWLPPGDPMHEAAVAMASRVRDLTEVLADRVDRLPFRSMNQTIAYQDACHLKQVQGIVQAPRGILSRVPGLIMVEGRNVANCCGSAGLYNFLHPGPARELASQMLSRLARPPVDCIVTGNPGCLLHLRQQAVREGRNLRVLHTAEMLDLALAEDAS